MAPDPVRPAKFQFTIGRAMLAIAVLALVLGLIRLGLVALLATAAVLYFYLLYRHVTVTPGMFLVAACALLFSTTRFGQAAVGIIGLILGYYVFLHRYALSGPSLPRRSPPNARLRETPP
jgi:hypothetical protein